MAAEGIGDDRLCEEGAAAVARDGGRPGPGGHRPVSGGDPVTRPRPDLPGRPCAPRGPILDAKWSTATSGLIRARYASPRYEREPTQSGLGQDPMNSSCDVESPLPDLTDADLTKLLSSNDSVLRQALQRVREQSSTGEQIVAGFNAVI